MRVIEDQHTIELTERNLKALLAKLAGFPANSACTITKHGWAIRAVPDEAHYTNCPPGPMVYETEASIS